MIALNNWALDVQGLYRLDIQLLTNLMLLIRRVESNYIIAQFLKALKIEDKTINTCAYVWLIKLTN